MELVLLLLALLGFWFFIAWDRKRLQDQAEREVGSRRKGEGFSPKVLISTSSLFIGSGAFALIALSLALHPPAPPFTGRGAWITELLHALLGRYGPALGVLALALVCFGYALACVRSKATSPHFQ